MRAAPEHLLACWNNRKNWPDSLSAKCADLSQLLNRYAAQGMGVALSGGQDSMFLLITAYCCGLEKLTAVTVQSALIPSGDLQASFDLCRWLGIEHIILDVDILGLHEVRNNVQDRCYHCKKHLFEVMQGRLKNGVVLADGTNRDDDAEHRPGRRSLKELGILSPLHKSGFGKKDIVSALKELNAEWAIRAPSACLATRFPYGTELTAEKLQMVDKAEALLRERGFKQCRVRVEGDRVRLELQKDQIGMICSDKMRDDVVKAISHLGYKRVTLDLAGYRTGSWDKELIKN